MTKMLKKVRKAKPLVASALNLLIRSAEAGAATAALLAQAHNLIAYRAVLTSVSNDEFLVLAPILKV